MPSNGQLRTYQILVFLISGTAGLVVSISVGWTSHILEGECVLYSNMQITQYNNGSLSLVKATFGNPTECSFSTFCPVGVTIYCVIWIWFYIFLSDWGKTFIEDEPKKEEPTDRPPADQHLLVPSIVCNVVVLGLLLATVAIVEAGTSEWCEHVTSNLGDKTCDYVGDAVWLNVIGGKALYGYLHHAKISCWVLLISMVIQTLVIFIRLRRNSKRPRRESSLSEPFFDMILSEPLSDPLSDNPVSDLDSSTEDSSKPPTRRRLQRQKKVVIDVGDDDQGTSSNLLNQIDEYNEAPS